MIAVMSIAVFVYVLVRQLGQPNALDWGGVAISALGTLVAAKGKKDLSSSHAWAGYFRTGVPLVVHGVYSLIRHPIYSGIIAYIMGTFMTQYQHSAPVLALTNSILASYLVAFLLMSARRERTLLRLEFGEAFEKYASEVPAFVPRAKTTLSALSAFLGIQGSQVRAAEE
jgi:protein-S-isoprenylcysteine O-methyltransferase Ste14